MEYDQQSPTHPGVIQVTEAEGAAAAAVLAYWAARHGDNDFDFTVYVDEMHPWMAESEEETFGALDALTQAMTRHSQITRQWVAEELQRRPILQYPTLEALQAALTDVPRGQLDQVRFGESGIQSDGQC